MRYSVINGLLLLAVSPLAALALPVDPSDQTGQWDPSGQYRKGHWQNGEFVANNGDNRYNQNGQYDQNGRYNQNGQYNNPDGRWSRRSMVGQPLNSVTALHAREWPNDNQNSQNGWTDRNGQWHANNQDQNGWTDDNGQWHADNQDQNGWTDQNGQWHANNENNQNGWTDNNGQWHANNQDQNGWTDQNGQWHANNENNQNGWTDSNGQWHANQKRQAPPGQAYPTSINNGRFNGAGHEDKANPMSAVGPHTPHRRSWRDAGNDQNSDYSRNRNCDHNDWNCRNKGHYDNNDQCRGVNRGGQDCRKQDNLPRPSVIARNSPNDSNNLNSANNAQVTPSSQNSRYQSYGNYKNYGSYQNYPANGQNQAQDRNIKATTGQQE